MKGLFTCSHELLIVNYPSSRTFSPNTEAGNTPSATAYSNAVAACGARAGRRGLLLVEEMILGGMVCWEMNGMLMG